MIAIDRSKVIRAFELIAKASGSKQGQFQSTNRATGAEILHRSVESAYLISLGDPGASFDFRIKMSTHVQKRVFKDDEQAERLWL